MKASNFIEVLYAAYRLEQLAGSLNNEHISHYVSLHQVVKILSKALKKSEKETIELITESFNFLTRDPTGKKYKYSIAIEVDNGPCLQQRVGNPKPINIAEIPARIIAMEINKNYTI